MFHYISLIIFLFSAVNADNKLVTPYWEDCGGTDAILKIHNIVLDDPVQIGKSVPIRITMNATQKTTLSGESRVSIKINKNLRVFGQNLPIPVPCINGIGTCEMSLCEIFKIHRKLVCAILESANQECVCPTAPGDYFANDVKYTFDFGFLPSALLAIGNGDYKLEMKINDDNKQLACMKLAVSVKFVK